MVNIYIGDQCETSIFHNAIKSISVIVSHVLTLVSIIYMMSILSLLDGMLCVLAPIEEIQICARIYKKLLFFLLLLSKIVTCYNLQLRGLTLIYIFK